MVPNPCQRPQAGGRSAWRNALLTVCACMFEIGMLLGTSAAPSLAATSCLGDCDGNGEVTVDDLVVAVNIALGNESIDHCRAADSNGDGELDVAELVAAVGQALSGCGTPPTLTPTPIPSQTPTPVDAVTITGGCRKPGPLGLVPCTLGTLITVWRCDDRNACPADLDARTQLGSGPTDTHGAFTVAVARSQTVGALLLMDAAIDNATVYRIMDFGVAGGASAGEQRGQLAAAVMLDPSSEAGVRLLDENGVANFADEGIADVQSAVRTATEVNSFANLSPATAADLATSIARNDPQVQLVILQNKFTPTPTVTPPATPVPTLAPTGTPTPTVAPTQTPTHTATRTQSPEITLTPTPVPPVTSTPTGTATSTVTRTGTRTPTGSPTSTPTRTASPSRTSTATPTFSATRTSSRTPSDTPTSTPTRTFSPTRTNTATPTLTPTPTSTRTPTNTPTRTPTRTATPTRTVTPTVTLTPTLAPFLSAQITTDRGCLENGDNAAYTVGEPLSIFYRVDGQNGGQAIAQAQVTLIDIPPNQQGVVILSATEPAGQTNAFDAQVSPPTGTETVVIQAQVSGFSSAQDQCSFQVVQASGCMTACDCPTEQMCNALGMCENGVTPVYCCEHNICPPGAACQHIGGNPGMCAAP